jgi:uncharacterized repeat protein (TIGR03803 family)
MAKVPVSLSPLLLIALLALSSCGGTQSKTPPKQPTFTVLYSFTGGTDGAIPNATVVRDASGNLYGTTQHGADLSCNVSLQPGCGTVFRLDNAGKVTALYTFPGGSRVNGSGLVLDENGNLYGSADPGLGHGFVYELGTSGTFTELYNFTGGSDGDLPGNLLLRDAVGNLYGTTQLGGGSNDPLCPNSQGCGTVFGITFAGQYQVLYRFLDNADGAVPQGVIRDGAGNLFGVTSQGGQGCQPINGCGTIFKIDPLLNKTTLYAFIGGNDGSTPLGNLVLDSAGNLYGVANAGGDLTCPYNGGGGCGVVFKLDPNGVLSVLYAFHGANDGYAPISLTTDAAGNVYGMTQGAPNANPCGAIFKLDTQGKLTYLHILNGNTEGCGPVGGLVQDGAGNLYGTAGSGGYLGNPSVCFNGCGTVFKIEP